MPNVEAMKPASCICHSGGARQVPPRSNNGLEEWYEFWYNGQSLESLKPFFDLLPVNNTNVSYHSAIIQLWYAVHPESPASKKKLAFKGVPKSRVEPLDQQRLEDELKRRNSIRGKPTSDRDRITLYKRRDVV